jgi:hypothetical protein
VVMYACVGVSIVCVGHAYLHDAEDQAGRLLGQEGADGLRRHVTRREARAARREDGVDLRVWFIAY